MKLTQLVLAMFTALAFTTAHAATYTDEEITEIMKVANDGEIDAGKIAEKHAVKGDVKDFGKHMVTEHKKNMDENKKVSKDQKIKMKSSDMSKNLQKDTKEKLSSLKKADKSQFDAQYIQLQIDMHQSLLTELDNSLIPSAKNPDLKSFLEKTKTHVQEHLAKAQEIQSGLSTTK
jgi:putative membrane protein